MKARITVTLKSGVLDPQGRAIANALHSLGFENVEDVRQGKLIEVQLKAAGRGAGAHRARRHVQAAARQHRDRELPRGAGRGMSKAEPAILMVLLALVLATLAVRLTLGKYMSTSMALLDCRLGYYGLLSWLPMPARRRWRKTPEWIAVNVADGHFLFSKPAAPAHPMVVRRKTRGCRRGVHVVDRGLRLRRQGRPTRRR